MSQSAFGGLVPALLLGPNNPVVQPLLTQFKQEIQNRYPAQSGLQAALTQLENRPDSDSWQRVFYDEARRAQADQDQTLLAIMRQLTEIVKTITPSGPTTVTATGGGAVAVGQGNAVVGARGVHVGGNVGGSVITGDSSQGGIVAHTIKAENVVQGILHQGGDLSDSAGLVALAEALRQGRITADSIEAKNVVAGFQYIADPIRTTPDELRQEVAQLRQQLERAINAGELSQTGDISDVQDALQNAETELQGEKPEGNRIIRKLKEAADVLTQSARVAEAAGKVGQTVIKLAPIAATLYQIAIHLFGK